MTIRDSYLYDIDSVSQDEYHSAKDESLTYAAGQSVVSRGRTTKDDGLNPITED